MMTEIIMPHQKLILANRLAHIPHDLLGLGPSMHTSPVIIPLMVMKLQRPLAIAPRFDAQFFFLVAVPLVQRLGAASGIARELAPGHAPAVFRQTLAACDALFGAHGGLDGTAFPVEGVEVAELVGIEFEVHVGGELGLRVGEEVFGGADAGGLAEGVEVRGPPDRVPDEEVLGPVAVVDGAGVGGVPGLVEVGVFGHGGVSEDGGRFFGGVVEHSGGEAVEDADGTGGGRCGFDVVDDGDGWAGGGHWVLDNLDGRFQGKRSCRHHGDHGGRRGRRHCGGVIE